MGYYLHFSSFFVEKKILNLLENSGLKSRFLFSSIFQFYLMYRLICQKPANALFAQTALVSTFFQIFIVLGMYNFGQDINFWSVSSLVSFKCIWVMVIRVVKFSSGEYKI